MHKIGLKRILNGLLLDLKDYAIKKRFIENVLLTVILLLTAILITSIKNTAKEKIIEEEDVKIYTMLENNYANVEKNDDTDSEKNEKDDNENKKTLYNNSKTYEIININNASSDKLMQLPGIGEKIAEDIIEYRNKKGKFINIEDLKNVVGIGDKKFEKIRDYITI